MTFQPCRPATIKLLPYRGTSFCGAAPFLRNPAQWAAAVRLQKKLQQKDSQQMRGVV